MKLLTLVYSGPDPRHITDILDAQHVPGHTVLEGARGAGGSGKIDGTRAWPGSATVILSFVPNASLEPVRTALRAYHDAHTHGEHLHVAAVPLESYF